MNSFLYERPNTKEELVSCLVQGNGQARLLAGGTDLLTQIRSRLVQPRMVVDLKKVEELHTLEMGPQGLTIGAAVILNRLLEEPRIKTEYPALWEGIADLASCAIRNRATLVGNVTNASPCADTVPPLCVMEAHVEIFGPTGSRRVPVGQFITGVRQVQLGPGELATRILVPRQAPGTFSAFLKQKRVKGHDLALANAALLRDPDQKRLRLSVGSCNPMPLLISLDDLFDRPDAEQAVRRAQAQVKPIDDVRASIEYRREMVAVMVRRLLDKMAQATT